jgi:hypothetical protein
VRTDAIACEPQFLDHLAPIWRALPERGTFHVDAALADRADRRISDFAVIDADAIRRGSRESGPRPGDGPACLVASYGDIKVARRMGYRRFAFLEHGIGQAYTPVGRKGHGSYAGGTDRDDCELFLCPNEYSAEHWRRAYPGARVEVVGGVRLADLPRLEPPANVGTVGVVIDPQHRGEDHERERNRNEPGDSPERHDEREYGDDDREDDQRDGDVSAPDGHFARAISHPPTIAVSFHWPAHVHPFAGNALGDFMHALPALAERYTVIGHAHPKGDWPTRMARIYAKAGIPFVRDFDDVCRQADLYIADNTSSLYEFAATGRPVVVLNGRYWERKVELGLRFWEAAHVGVNVDPVHRRGVLDNAATTAALLAGVAEALEDSPAAQERRQDALGIVYGYRGADAAQRASRAVLAWLEQRMEIAA